MANMKMEVDRTENGSIKVNVVSVANLVAIVGLLITAIGTWNGLVSRVDRMELRIDTAIKEDQARESDFRELRTQVNNSIIRLSVMETQLQSVGNNVKQLGDKMDKVLAR